jgi:hypothetical protein
MGIWQFAQRSLNTVSPDRKLKRLVYYPVDSGMARRGACMDGGESMSEPVNTWCDDVLADGLAERVADAFQQAVLLELEFAQEGAWIGLDPGQCSAVQADRRPPTPRPLPHPHAQPAKSCLRRSQATRGRWPRT